MPLIGKPRKVRFPKISPNPTSSLVKTMSTDSKPRPGIPALFTQPPAIRDPLITETIDLQNATLEKCLPFLKGIHSTQTQFNEHGVPALQRDVHTGYLYDALEDYPEGFVAMDASRPWIVYWALAGLAMLGEDTTQFRERCVHYFLAFFYYFLFPASFSNLLFSTCHISTQWRASRGDIP
jgi:protein farnesyltransferase subunit beta